MSDVDFDDAEDIRQQANPVGEQMHNQFFNILLHEVQVAARNRNRNRNEEAIEQEPEDIPVRRRIIENAIPIRDREDYMNILTTPRNIEINKTKWKIMLDLEDIFKKNGMSIFGGYVRDKIIHNHFAKKFYESLGDTTNVNIANRYKDVNFMPEFKDRFIIPMDFDCFIETLDITKLDKDLRDKQFYIKNQKTRQAKRYFGFIAKRNLDHVYHTKIVVSLNMNQHLTSYIHNTQIFDIIIDIMHIIDKKQNNEPLLDIYNSITQNIDFDCNGIIICPDDTLKLCSKKAAYNKDAFENHSDITNIINNIIERKATILDIKELQHNQHRIRKMIKKGWTIKSDNFDIVKYIENNQEEDTFGHCLICHGGFTNSHFIIKDSKCAAYYHANCFKDMILHRNFNYECPNCTNKYKKDILKYKHILTTIFNINQENDINAIENINANVAIDANADGVDGADDNA